MLELANTRLFCTFRETRLLSLVLIHVHLTCSDGSPELRATFPLVSCHAQNFLVLQATPLLARLRIPTSGSANAPYSTNSLRWLFGDMHAQAYKCSCSLLYLYARSSWLLIPSQVASALTLRIV